MFINKYVHKLHIAGKNDKSIFILQAEIQGKDLGTVCPITRTKFMSTTVRTQKSMKIYTRGEDEPDDITYEIRNFQRQSSGSRLRILCCSSSCQSDQQQYLRYIEDDMSESYNRLAEETVTEWPSLKISIKRPIKSVVKREKNHCLCQKSSNGEMIQCSKCLYWFRKAKCVPLKVSRKSFESMEWLGPCCSENKVDAAPTIIDSDSD